jgi:hypothetical protein
MIYTNSSIISWIIIRIGKQKIVIVKSYLYRIECGSKLKLLMELREPTVSELLSAYLLKQTWEVGEFSFHNNKRVSSSFIKLIAYIIKLIVVIRTHSIRIRAGIVQSTQPRCWDKPTSLDPFIRSSSGERLCPFYNIVLWLSLAQPLLPLLSHFPDIRKARAPPLPANNMTTFWDTNQRTVISENTKWTKLRRILIVTILSSTSLPQLRSTNPQGSAVRFGLCPVSKSVR